MTTIAAVKRKKSLLGEKKGVVGWMMRDLDGREARRLEADETAWKGARNPVLDASDASVMAGTVSNARRE